MKKNYSKPEICCVDCKTGAILSTSEMFVTKTKEMIHLLDNYSENAKESMTYGKEAAMRSIYEN